MGLPRQWKFGVMGVSGKVVGHSAGQWSAISNIGGGH